MSDIHLENLMKQAGLLTGANIQSIAPVKGGGNNRMFQVQTSTRAFAVKCYPTHLDNAGLRQTREIAACNLLQAQSFTHVQKLVASDEQAGISVFEWVDGPSMGLPDTSDLQTALQFTRQLRQVSQSADADKIGPAAEACLSPQTLIDQVGERFQVLQTVGKGHPALGGFLDQDLAPFLEQVLSRVRNGYHERSWDLSRPLEKSQLTLNPSDFGFHNALRRANGHLVFIDFEYFGWDDPVRLVADFILHPGMQLRPDQRTDFVTEASGIFRNDPDFEDRLILLYPLVGLRWIAILLNEFIPEKWARRAFAGDDNRPKAQQRQLEKARRLLPVLEAFHRQPGF